MNQSLVNSKNSKKNFIETTDVYIDKIRKKSISFSKIPEKIKTYEMCLVAVKTNPFNLNKVPEKFLTEEMCLEALKQSDMAMIYVPKKMKTKSFYLKAIAINEECLSCIPKQYIDDDMCEKLISTNGMNLKYVDDSKKTKEICLKAFENNPSCIEYIPEKYVNDEMYIKAVKHDCNMLKNIPERLRTKDIILNTLTAAIKAQKNGQDINNYAIGMAIPEQFEFDKEIIILERQCNIRKIMQKNYNKEDNKFHVIEKFSYRSDYINKEFDSFDKFNEYVNDDLSEADLLDFDFKNVDLKKIDYSNAFINSEVLIKNNLYDPSFYKKIMLDNKEYLNIPYQNEPDGDNIINTYRNNALEYSNNNQKIYYISDLHLYHKLSKKFPEHATQMEIIHFISKIIDKMIVDADIYDCILIGGDTSSCFDLTKIFFELLRKKWKGEIITILGNHEIWNLKNEISSLGLDDIIQKYRNFFGKLDDVILLQNELLFFHEDGIKILDEEKIINSKKDYLQELSNKSRLIILGGLGFSGLNEKYNANCGLYRNTIKTLNEDIKQTNRFNSIYQHIKSSLDKTKIIVLTHTPKENWNNEAYVKKWIYVNGHTHQNSFTINDEKTIYSDNQIGYYKDSIGLKFFEISNIYNYFQYYENGKYEISREEYFTFNRGLKINMDFNKSEGTLFMLKKNNIYCFLYQSLNKRLSLLNGGKILKLKNQNINYYYENMDILALAINNIMKNYNNTLKEISKSIKSIGGDGRIHGCIIDIDWYNHIYLNPYDGKISYYYATSMSDKHSYNSLKSLLANHNKNLLEKYENQKDNPSSLKKSLTAAMTENKSISEFVSETFMYPTSNKILTLQYLTELNVIRFWNDEVIDKIKKKMELLQLDYKN